MDGIYLLLGPSHYFLQEKDFRGRRWTAYSSNLNLVRVGVDLREARRWLVVGESWIFFLMFGRKMRFGRLCMCSVLRIESSGSSSSIVHNTSATCPEN